MPPIAARHIEQSPFFAERSFQEVGFGPGLLGGDGLTPKVVGDAMEKIFEPIAAVSHQSGTVTIAMAATQPSTSQRTRIVDIAFVELDVLLRQVGGINKRAGLAQVQVDVQIEFSGCDGGAEFFEAGFGWLTVFEAPKDIAACRSAVADVNLLFDNPRGAVAEGGNDSAPVRVAAVPTGFDQRAVSDGPRGGIGIGERLRPFDLHGHKARYALAISHDHFRQFEANVAQSRLEGFELN